MLSCTHLLQSYSLQHTEEVQVVCFQPSAESLVSSRRSLVRLTLPLTRVVSSSAISVYAVADLRYFVARCWRYLAIGFDDGVFACRDEEEADVLVVSPLERARASYRDQDGGVVIYT
jgi:hypothetical protein